MGFRDLARNLGALASRPPAPPAAPPDQRAALPSSRALAVNTFTSDSLGRFPYATGGSLYSRYTLQYRQILLAQELYESESYASAIIHNIIDFAVGEGALVDWGDEYSQDMWDHWKWSTQAKQSLNGELQRLAGTHLIRDGDIFARYKDQAEGIKFYMVNPAYIRSWGTAKKQQGGVLVNDDLTPIGYLYQPVALPWQSLADREPEEISPDEIIHIYKQEWDLQARGQSWLRKAFGPLEALAKFDRYMLAAGEIAVSASGYWTLPMKYLMEYDPDYSNPQTDAEASVVDMILESKTLDDIRSVQKLVEGFEWHEQKTSGIGDGMAIQAIHTMLAMRACRGIGVSKFAVLLSYDSNVGFMAARNITESDKRFYQTVQMYLCQFVTGAADAWAEHMTRTDPEFRHRYQGFYEIYCAGQPYLDPAKDAQYYERMIGANIMSPQEAMRLRNKNPQRVMAEIKEWAKYVQEVKDETGVDLLAQSVQADPDDVQEAMDAMDTAMDSGVA